MGTIRNRGDTLYGQTITESMFYAMILIGDTGKEDALLCEFYREEYARVEAETKSGAQSAKVYGKRAYGRPEQKERAALYERLIRHVHGTLHPDRAVMEDAAYETLYRELSGREGAKTDALIRRYYKDLRAKFKPDRERVLSIRERAVQSNERLSS